jgi:hypothetical protein
MGQERIVHGLEKEIEEEKDEGDDEEQKVGCEGHGQYEWKGEDGNGEKLLF